MVTRVQSSPEVRTGGGRRTPTTAASPAVAQRGRRAQDCEKSALPQVTPRQHTGVQREPQTAMSGGAETYQGSAAQRRAKLNNIGTHKRTQVHEPRGVVKTTRTGPARRPRPPREASEPPYPLHIQKYSDECIKRKDTYRQIKIININRDGTRRKGTETSCVYVRRPAWFKRNVPEEAQPHA